MSTTLLRLNKETRAFHDTSDKGWVALLASDVSHSRYTRQLVVTHGFETPLEAAFARSEELRAVVDLQQRSRASFLAKDLFALGVTQTELAALPQCSIAPFSGAIEALGWMYVCERATLLHQRVRRHLLAKLSNAHDICAYVSAYDGVVSARWTELGHIVGRTVASDQVGALVHAARTAFQSLIDWAASAAGCRA